MIFSKLGQKILTSNSSQSVGGKYHRIAVQSSNYNKLQNRSQSAAQQQPFEPKKRLLDLDDSDDILDEEDELDAELSWLMIEKLSICNL